ncbi:MAG: HD domain-containing protein [Candidatus Tectomicrobia bacterium]|nr:HD domain-containing protein [Candidatus Tectomicrobia bacterium]
MIFDAIEFATKAHTGQFRKGTNVPYIVHPLAVAKTLIDCGCSEEVIVAGILHDTVEDTSVTLEDIRQLFGEEVAKLVEGASEPDKSDTWENRKRHTIEYLKTAPINILLVACADKFDNIKTIREDYAKVGESIWSRFNRSKEHQRWYYQALVDVFTNRMQGEPTASLFQQFKSEVQKVFQEPLTSSPLVGEDEGGGYPGNSPPSRPSPARGGRR